jgi:hypothetical protein
MALRSLLSAAESDLERVADAYCGPMRQMRQKISKLKQTIRGLPEHMLCNSDDDSGDDESFDSMK